MESFPVPFQLLGGCLQSLVFLGLQMHCSNSTFLWLSPCLFLSSCGCLLIRIPVILNGGSIVLQYGLNLNSSYLQWSYFQTKPYSMSQTSTYFFPRGHSLTHNTSLHNLSLSWQTSVYHLEHWRGLQTALCASTLTSCPTASRRSLAHTQVYFCRAWQAIFELNFIHIPPLMKILQWLLSTRIRKPQLLTRAYWALRDELRSSFLKLSWLFPRGWGPAAPTPLIHFSAGPLVFWLLLGHFRLTAVLKLPPMPFLPLEYSSSFCYHEDTM